MGLKFLCSSQKLCASKTKPASLSCKEMEVDPNKQTNKNCPDFSLLWDYKLLITGTNCLGTDANR